MKKLEVRDLKTNKLIETHIGDAAGFQKFVDDNKHKWGDLYSYGIHISDLSAIAQVIPQLKKRFKLW